MGSHKGGKPMTDLEIYEAFKKLYWEAKEKGDQKVSDMQKDLQGFLDTKTDWPNHLKEHLAKSLHGYFNGEVLSRSEGTDRRWDSVYHMIGVGEAREKEVWGSEGYQADKEET